MDDDTLVIFVADHGEEFRDRGRQGHKNQLYMELVHVPLIARWPSHFRAHRVSENVSTIDLLPTPRALVQARPGAQDRGIKLGAALAGGSLDAERPLFAMRANELLKRPLWRRAVIRGSPEYIWSMPGDQRELDELASDPTEMHDIATLDQGRADALHTLLDHELQSQQVYPRAFAPDRPGDDALEGRLRSLGYGN